MGAGHRRQSDRAPRSDVTRLLHHLATRAKLVRRLSFRFKSREFDVAAATTASDIQNILMRRRQLEELRLSGRQWAVYPDSVANGFEDKLAAIFAHQSSTLNDLRINYEGPIANVRQLLASLRHAVARHPPLRWLDVWLVLWDIQERLTQATE